MVQAELHLPADVQWVGLVRLVVCRAAALAGMEAARIEDLRVAVSEATSNAMRAHDLEDATDARVVITFGVGEDDEFQVTVQDAGEGFEPSTVDIETRDWTMEGGLGITVLRALADSVAFERRDGTRVDMRFGLSLVDRAAAADEYRPESVEQGSVEQDDGRQVNVEGHATAPLANRTA